MIAAVKSGEVDMVTAVAPSAIPVLEKEPSVNLIETAAGTHPTFAMYTDTPPFNDVRVRQALKLVVDRQMMVDTAMLGYAEPGNDSPVPPTSPNNFSSEIPKRDIAKAKKLLAEAGFAKGIELDLYTGEWGAGIIKTSELFAEMAKEAGIKINLIVRPADGYWEDTWMKFPFVVGGWSRRPPLAIIGLIYSKDAKWNETHWNRQDFEVLVSKANRTMDTDKRTQVVKKALRLLAEEGGAIVPYFMHNVSSLRKNCSGYEPHVQTFIFNYENLACN
jgi:peptide/nickel transport system substrate-binding protein